MDTVAEVGEGVGEEEVEEGIETVAEKDGTEEEGEEEGREGTAPTLMRTKEVVDNGTVLLPT